MTTPIMVPAKPEEKHFCFKYGITFELNRFAMVCAIPESLDFDCLPYLLARGDDDNLYNYIFVSRVNVWAKFSPFTLKGNGKLSIIEKSHSDRVVVPVDKWMEALALYFDFLSAQDEENAAREKIDSPSYHLIVDQYGLKAERLVRRLIGSYYSRAGVRYALRQESAWQRSLWGQWNASNAFWESAQRRDFDVVEDFADPDQVQVRLTTSYPYSRGRRKPFTTVWRWHLSRQVPLVEAGTVPPEEADGERHERWTHRPGDPKILRETGTGLFGSFPSFEGDDEPEYQDER